MDVYLPGGLHCSEITILELHCSVIVGQSHNESSSPVQLGIFECIKVLLGKLLPLTTE